QRQTIFRADAYRRGYLELLNRYRAPSKATERKTGSGIRPERKYCELAKTIARRKGKINN
ncbi:MAG: hypothetical protein ACREOR_02700, partial [Candidatus Binatia bacterium]